MAYDIETQKLLLKNLGGMASKFISATPLGSGLSKAVDMTIDTVTKPTNTTTQTMAVDTTYDDMLADYKAEQERLAAAQRESRISALGKARDSALSGLDAELATVEPYYYDKRNEAAGNSDVGAMNFAQYMAGRGIKGAAGAIPEIYRNNALQGQVGKLDQAETAEKQDIARRGTDINSAYESDVVSANADIDAQTMQNYIDMMKTVEAQRVADNATMGLTSTGQQTLAGQNNDIQNYVNTIGRFEEGYQTEINNVQNDGDPSNDWQVPYLQAARQEKIQRQAEQKAAAAAAASEAEAAQYKAALDLWTKSGVATTEIAGILGVPVGAKTADFNIDSINAQTAQTNAQTSRINANKARTPSASEIAKQQLNEKITAIRKDLDTLPTRDAYNELFYNSQGYIDDLGLEEYNKLVTYYKAKDQGAYYNQD